jgi:PIN domain nuclease of toxin-antitoxin system
MIVLDTHVLLWWASGTASELSKKASSAIKRAPAEGGILVSSITAWEIAMLVKRGRLVLTIDVSTWLSLVSRAGALRFVPVDNEIALASVSLPGEFHQDPADRIIVATARKSGATVVTRDQRIRGYQHVKSVW